MATYNKETFKRLFQSKFNLSKWQMLLQDYFHADKVRVNAEVLDEDAEDRKGYFLGSMTTQDNYELGFFYYEMEDGSVLRRKVGLRNLIRPYLGYGFDAALAVFNDGTNWRLSLICDLKEDATSTKRFTYVFGDEKAFYKTPILRFESLRTKANEFLEIKKAFSVEALSDDFFDSYNFTIDENDPNDAEVGVDPEMLGKIFENLLEDNKDKGAFYTPKEIVRYMCQESLTAYLQTGIDDAEVKEHIANFVKTNDVEELGGASSELAMSIDRKLIDVKICDPAIGSGAFPMGLLRELYACRKSIEIFEEDNAADIKRHIIQNNIYGVDIEKGAVDIARLRFWLALIIDEKEPMPLPNLDFKIMQGNSLLESYKGVDLDVTSKKLKTGKDTKKTRGVLSLGFEETDVQKVIQDLVKSYFSITDHTLRAQRRQQIDKYVKDYIKVCAEGNHEVQDAVDELEIPNDQFFLWHTYFADVFEKGGFDIVIGNPPYGVSIKDDYRKAVVASLGNVPDYEIYYYFIVLAAPLLKEKGIMSYIIPNTFLFNTFAKLFREMLVEKWNVLEILDCTKFPIFESAVVRNAINLFQKDSEGSKQVGYRNTANVTSFSDLLEREREFMTVESLLTMNQNWGLAYFLPTSIRNVVNLISSSPLAVKDFFPEISQGLIAYDKYKGQSEEIIKSRAYHSFVYKDGLKKWLWGEDVTRYNLTWNGKEYIDYCNGIANPRNPSFFVGKRMLVREITNPSIFAALIEIEAYNDPSIIIVKESRNYPIEILVGIMNSKLATFFHFNHSPKATKGAFPKILVQDIKEFPLPKVNSDERKILMRLVDNVTTIKKRKSIADTSALENQIDFLVYHLYGLTYDEVLIVDPETPISREEYEAYKEE